MSELTDLSGTDASNTTFTSLAVTDAALANTIDNIMRAIMGAIGRANAGTAPVADTWTFGDPADLTKRGRADMGNVTAGQTRIVNWPDANLDLANVQMTMKGHITGLTLSNNSGDATNDIDIATGRAASGETTPVLMTLSSALTKRLDAAWAVGTNQGGLDTGAIANTTYHIWLIRRSDTGVVDALFSTSASSPTMPTNYDQKRRIGSIIRSGGAIVAFTQLGDEFLRKVPVNDIAAANPGASAVSATLSVPVGIQVGAIISVGYTDASPVGGTAMIVTSLDTTDTAPAHPTLASFSATAAATGGIAALPPVRTNTSAQVRYRASQSTADHTFYIHTFGWNDRRGQDD